MIEPASVPDVGAFLARLLRLDPAAVVRLKPAGAGTVALWARLPFEVLVTRGVRATVEEDVTVRAGALLAAVERGEGLPARQDRAWRWPLPPVPGRVVEVVPAAEIGRVAAAAAATVRDALASGVGGRAVGDRMVRDALLDHVPIVVIDGAHRVAVPQRLVQAVVRMGFLPASGSASSAHSPGPAGETVEVRRAGPWVGLAAAYGQAWHRAGGPALRVRTTSSAAR
jgi:hypothetical protein